MTLKCNPFTIEKNSADGSSKKSLLAAGLLSALLAVAPIAQATTVQFQTVLGDFEVNLFDKTTPETVKNFLAYVNAEAYTDSIIHRSVPGFIVQGGGFTYSGKLPLNAVTQLKAVVNEPVFSNRRGTIAMAKIGGNPNSATSQWFFNLKDNSTQLDNQNGGFTVFGEVTGNGMAIIDAMAALNRFNKGGATNEIPLRDYTAGDHVGGVEVTEEHLVMIQNVVVLDASPDTADGLNPIKNTLVGKDKDSGSSGGSSGGGSINLLTILGLGMLAVMRGLQIRRRSQSA
jgi:peptidyl-prolyl cis-trans isomerase A (cyclophilin A)